MQSFFKVPKHLRTNFTHCFIMRIPNKKELQQIEVNHSSDIVFKDFIKIYKKCIAKKNSFLVNDATIPSYFLYVLEKIFYNKHIIKS